MSVGKRFIYIREKLLNKPRIYFLDAYGLKESTLRNREKSDKLSDKIIQEMCEIYQKEGINCVFDWAKYGKGDSPLDIDISKIGQDMKTHLNAITSESTNDENIQIFSLHHDLLLPAFEPGDIFQVKEAKIINQHENLYVHKLCDNRTIIGFTKRITQTAVIVSYINTRHVDYIPTADIYKSYLVNKITKQNFMHQ
jgi:hypothetical protein